MTSSSPRRAPWIVVHEPMAEGAPWIVERPGVNPLRVSADIGALLTTLDGERDVVALAGVLGPRWTPELVDGAVDKLDQLGLLEGRDSVAPAPDRRFVFVSPTTLQFRIVQAARLLDPFRSLLTRLSGSAVLTAALVLSFGGLVALAWQGPVLGQALGAPLPLSAMMLIWVGVVVTTIVHEFGHGATLTHFHGRPGWLGVMLFYLTPACFCEVTDSWRLARRSQRVAVAMAGVAVQASVAGTAAVFALMLPDGDARTTLIGFAVVCYLSGVINLIPLVKLDGYLALMAWLDIPHLRDKAMADARGWLTHRLFGVPFDRELPRRRWAVPFGMACIGFPALILLVIAGRWSHLLLSLGTAGAVLVLLLISYLGYLIVRGTFSLLRKARRAGVSWTRLVAVTALACVSLAAPLTFITVRNDIRSGYVNDDTGVHFVLPPGAKVTAGDRVILQRSGLVFSTDLGIGEIGPGEPHRTTVPLSALMPVRAGIPAEAVVVPLEDATGQLDPAGTARIVGEPMAAGPWLAHNYLMPAWRQIFGQES